MVSQRTVVLIGVLSLAAGWLAGTTSAPVAQDPSVESRSRPLPLGVQPAKAGLYREHLREKLGEQPRSPAPGRNPFVFGAGRAASAAPVERADTGAAPPEPEAPAAALSTLPIFRMSGVASVEKDGVIELTAIVIDNGSMVFAKAGDKLSGGYSVVRVDEDSVVLIDADGVTQTVRLP